MRGSWRFIPVLGVALLVCGAANGATIWTGPDITFSKADFADWTLPENQDRMTDNVWITRADFEGIFNIAQEPAYDGFDTIGPSPVDTEWAFGTTASWDTLSYSTWAQAAGGFPPGLVGQDMVVHLITDDVYLDLQFQGWRTGDDGGGGGFSYIRSTPEPGTIAVFALGGLLAVRRRR